MQKINTVYTGDQTGVDFFNWTVKRIDQANDDFNSGVLLKEIIPYVDVVDGTYKGDLNYTYPRLGISYSMRFHTMCYAV